MSFGSKAVQGPLIDRSLEPSLAMARRFWPDSQRRRLIRTGMEAARGEYVKRLDSLLDLSREKAIATAKTMMVVTFDAAMRAGYALAGLPKRQATERELIAMAKMVEFEIGKFAAFHASVASEARRHRSKLYGGAVNAAFWRGWVATLPVNAKIDWRLGIAEHCPDCPELARKGPYDKPGHGERPLPTVPTNGDTACMGNCYCSLVASGPDWFSRLVDPPSIEVIAISGMAVAPTSDAGMGAAALYDNLVRGYAWELRMAILEPGAGHQAKANAFRREIDAMAARLGHKIRFPLTDDEVQEPMLDALAAGLRFVPASKVGEDLLDLLAALVFIDHVEKGKVIGIARGRVKIEGHGWIDIGRDAGTVLFVEDASR